MGDQLHALVRTRSYRCSFCPNFCYIVCSLLTCQMMDLPAEERNGSSKSYMQHIERKQVSRAKLLLPSGIRSLASMAGCVIYGISKQVS